MTDEQLDLLREIIQKEISYATMDNGVCMLAAAELEKECYDLWESLKRTFEK